MCGINGIYGLEQVNQPREMVEAMNKALAHRGPDDENVWMGENVVLGHKRLSIIDLSAAGQQPITSADGRYTLTYNGELYNYQSIKARLTDYHFTTNTDTEVVLAAYQQWGRACLQEFNGMFAFALWDAQERQLLIARDRVGIKPLYYYHNNDSVVFSSELRALLSSGMVPRKLNHEGLVDYLRYQTVHAPKTLVEDVLMLMPGHYVLVSDNEFLVEKYWDITHSVQKGLDHVPPQDIKSNIHRLLMESVERRLVADVPFGAFLSGGIDSSVIVGLMSEVASKKVNTFSVTFDEEAFSEARYANIIAQKFNTDHHEIRLTPNDFLELVPDALAAMDHPSGDGPNTYVVSKVTKAAGITMALSGLGGDELFAGYDIFKRSVKLEEKRWLTSFPVQVRKMGGGLLKTFKPSVASDKIAALLRLDYMYIDYTYPLSRQVLMDHEILKVLKRKTLPENKVFQIAHEAMDVGGRGYGLPLLSKVSFLEINTYLQNVLLRDTDQMSMAHALEVRVPFLDHELMEYVFGVSDQLKYPHIPKQLLLESTGDLIPREVYDRPKMGFTFPWSNWLKQELRDFAEAHLQALSQRSAFNAAEVMRLWERFLKDDPRVTWSRIWYLIVLENWLKQQQIED